MPLFPRLRHRSAHRLGDVLNRLRGGGGASATAVAPAGTAVQGQPPSQAKVGALGPASGHRAVLIACTILVLGIALSAATALLWRSNVRTHEKQSFQTSATAVTETVGTLLRRDTDFVATLNTVMTMQPNLSQSSFDRWYADLEGWQRQVGAVGTTVVAYVPPSELSAFLARRNADPRFRALVWDSVLPVAKGPRSHCLLSISESVAPLSRQVSQLVQEDWCQPTSVIGSTQAQLQRLATDSAQLLVFPVNGLGVRTTLFDSAYYKRGANISGLTERRGALRGWVISSFDMSALLKEAIGGHREFSAALYHSDPGRPAELLASEGSLASAATFKTSSVLPFEGIWRVSVSGIASTGGLSPNVQALLVFLGCALVTLLLTILVLVLGRSRARALGMVELKTGELRHQALHDALTGLPNRVLALDRAEQMLARARRQQLPVAALFVDVDGFKHVNDTFGHAAGDELLRMVAARLQGVVREGDTAARLGGDEFVVLVEGSTLDAGPELVAERLLEVLRQPYELDGAAGRRLALTVSIGVASGLRTSADELLRDADIAMYEAKGAGKDRYVLFRSDMQTLAQDRLTLEMDLSEALARDELFLLYQPTFDLRTERVIGVEALLRWRHPTRGVLEPEEFIPLAEDSGLIVPIGRWVLEQACAQAARWQERGLNLGVAVNVSGRQLDADELIDHVREALQSSGLDPGAVTLEVTETTLMADAAASAQRLRALKRLGVRIAIDDFGTGYSSLAYLRQFPADALKIDRSFVQSMTSSKQSTALVHTLVQLGRTLHLQTLAEGIEDEAQLKTLRRERCDQGQGFLFARPLDVEELEGFLELAGQSPAPLPAR